MVHGAAMPILSASRALHGRSFGRFLCKNFHSKAADITAAAHRQDLLCHLEMLSAKSKSEKDLKFVDIFSRIHFIEASVASNYTDGVLVEKFDKRFVMDCPIDNSIAEACIHWRCERHTNPHMGINDFEAIFSAAYHVGGRAEFPSSEARISTFECRPFDNTFNKSELKKFGEFCNIFFKISKSNGDITSMANRDRAWFVSFLCGHPSDAAFDVISEPFFIFFPEK